MATISCDVAVYGDHPSSINAAIEATRAGKRAILFTPEYHLGAPYAIGLGRMDVGKRGSKAFGRWTNWEYLSLLARHHAGGRWRIRAPSPGIAESCYRDLLKWYGVPVLTGSDWAIKESAGVSKSGTTITAVNCDGGDSIVAQRYIDGSEDGDLAAYAGCTMISGVESAATYSESLGGFQPGSSSATVDVTSSTTGTGYVWGVSPNPGLNVGDASPNSVQSFGWRLTVTDDSSNQRRWPKPDNYDPELFEFKLRTSNVGTDGPGTYNPLGPLLGTLFHGKRDVNDDTGWLQSEWPTATRARRAEILATTYAAKAGWMWYLANSPLVHDNIRRLLDTWRPAYDEYVDGSSLTPTAAAWPYTFYRRGTRRLVNAYYIMRQSDLQTNTTKTDTVATSHYNIDCHLRMVYATGGGTGYNTDSIQNIDGIDDLKRITPYEVGLSSLLTSEVDNLIVSNCIGASAVAYCSLRIDLWKANFGSVAGLLAARSLFDGASLASYRSGTGLADLQSRIEALGGVIHPA